LCVTLKQKQKMLLIQKSQRTVVSVGTDPMDGDSMLCRPMCEDAIIGSVIDASSRSDQRQLMEHAGGVTIRRFVS